MPQLDLSTFAPQLFWLAVFFFIIFIYSLKVTLPQLARVLRHRWELIEGNQQLAAKLQEEAEAIAQQINHELERARKRSHDQIVATSRDLAKNVSHQRHELSVRLKQRLREHELRVTHKEAQTMGEVQAVVQELTMAVVSKLLGEEPAISTSAKKASASKSKKGISYDL